MGIAFGYGAMTLAIASAIFSAGAITGGIIASRAAIDARAKINALKDGRTS